MGIGAFHGEFYCTREFDGVGQGTVGVARMVRVVDAPAFHHQEIAFLVLRQDIQRLARHFRQRGLTGGVLGAIMLVLHVRRLEQAKQMPDLLDIDRIELRLVPDVS